MRFPKSFIRLLRLRILRVIRTSTAALILDYRLAACPTEEEIKKLEEAVNEVIARQLPITTEFITQEEAQGRFDLERLPDGASETVRVVKVGDYDECLCIGVHVENTSEIGTFKIISHDWNEEAKRWRMRFKLV